MPLATIRPMGESGLYHIHFLDGSGLEHPDHELPGFPGRPGHLPARPGIGGERPGHLPAYGGGGRPVDPGYGHPEGGIPDHELPSQPPPQLLPGFTLVLVRRDGKWHYATLAPSSPPPRPLPEPLPPGGAPDQGLPPQPPTAGQLPGAPPTAQPKV
jgi:hypothetical protein